MRHPLLALMRAESADRPDPSASADRLVAAALLLCLLALAQPVRYQGGTDAGPASRPVDLVIIAGTAITMSLRDYVLDGQRIDRMTVARRLLDGLVEQYQGRRIALVVLGDPPALWLPLTTDKAAVRDALTRLRPVLGGRLSDTGAALRLVAEAFPGNGEVAVVMVTDGGLQLGAVAPLPAARSLATQGYSLYVIGVGSTDATAEQDEAMGLIHQPINSDFLDQLAQQGGGRYYHARDIDTYRAALTEIEAHHRRPITQTTAERPFEPWYPLPLGLAMALLLLAATRASSTDSD